MSDADDIEVMPEVELSSDSEEDEGDEISLIVMKRPQKVKRVVHDIEVVDPSQRGSAGGTFTAKERTGKVKEYIETEGLGVIICKDLGLVLFHVESFWIDGRPSTHGGRAKDRFPPGSEVNFLVRSFQGGDYKIVSEDEVLHQAVGVWDASENMPSSLMKVSLGEENTRKLEMNRKSFMLYVKGDVFIRVSLMRVKGEVAGYLTDDIGIIEFYDDKKEKINILFHASDVRIFKKDIGCYKGPCKRNLPVGLNVCVDARRIHMRDVKNVNYQAIIVLAGSWPAHPFPSLLRGGQGTYAPSYDVPENSTFYYLELPLESRLKRKVDEFASIVKGTRGKVEFDFRDVEYVKDKQDYIDWKIQMGGRREEEHYPRSRRTELKDCIDTFRSCHFVEEEMAVRNVTKVVDSRTWYPPEAWQHGGLKLVKKEERIDNEPTSESSIPSKRPRLTK